jgi:hypothetical protein
MQIICAMKKSGNLRLVDEKFHRNGKVPNISHPEDEDNNKLPSMFPNAGKVCIS